MNDLPFPKASQPGSLPNISSVTSIELPWERATPHDPPLMMFQICFSDGRRVSFAYSDLREIRCRDAGHITVGIYGLEKYHLTIEGRNLDELHSLLSMARIKSVIELGSRTFDRPEDSPCIDRIQIEALTGSSSYSPAP